MKSCRRCHRVCKGSICDKCRVVDNRERQARRPTSAERGYTQKYRQLRAIMIAAAWANGTPCHICGQCFKRAEDISADHIVPLSRSGTNSLDNLAPSHFECNSSRGNR